MHPLNSDATAIKQDDAPPCYEAILIDSDKIDKSEFPLSRDIKEKEKTIGGDYRSGNSSSGSKQVYKSKLRRKFNWKSVMISVITITAVIGSSVYIYLKMFKKSHDTNIAHGTAINAQLSPSTSASVNLAPPKIVRIVPRPKVEKVDKGTGTDFPFDEATSNGIVNLADVREREREMGVFNTVNTVNGNTVNGNTVNMQPLSAQSTFNNARRFPAASNTPISRFTPSPAPPPSNVQTRPSLNTPVHLQTPVAMESRMSTNRIVGVNQETRSPAVVNSNSNNASSESHASNTHAHVHADEQSQEKEVQIQTPQPSPLVSPSPSRSASASSESEIEIESISPASSIPQTSHRSSIGSEDELPMFYPLPFAILPDDDDQSEHESADTESD